ncbi:MAG: hypothetical protein LBU39_03670 [Desulfobulbaceae bacterium]|nr:hypothetical protein [Desulfobulbaceae bacterium]
MAQRMVWKKMCATLALGGLLLAAPQLAKADIAAGKNAAVVAQEAARGGMMPVSAALAAAQADPQSAVAIAVAVAQENPDAAVNIAGAMAQAQPDQAVDIVRAVAQLYPDRAQDIAAAAAKTICSDDQRKRYNAEKKQNLLDVCSALYAMLNPEGEPAVRGEEYEDAGPANMVPATVMQDSVGVSPGQDNAPASGI